MTMAVLRLWLAAALLSAALLLAQVAADSDVCDCNEQCIKYAEASEKEFRKEWEEKMSTLEAALEAARKKGDCNEQTELLESRLKEKEMDLEKKELAYQVQIQDLESALEMQKSSSGNDQEERQASCLAQVEDLKVELKEAKETSESKLAELEASHRKELEEVSSEQVASLQSKMDEVVTEKDKLVDDLQRQVKALNKDNEKLQSALDQLGEQQKQVINHLQRQVTTLSKEKERLDRDRDILAKDLGHHKRRVLELNHNYFESSKELLRTTERVHELHELHSTTRINVTLIRQDIEAAATTVYDLFMTHVWIPIRDEVSPYWNEYVAPHLAVLIQVASKATSVVIEKGEQYVVAPSTRAATHVAKLTKEHVGPLLEEHVTPVIAPGLKPLMDFRRDLLTVLTTVVETCSRTFHSYLEMQGYHENCKVCNLLLRLTDYSSKHAEEVVRAMQLTGLAFVAFCMVAFVVACRRRRTRRRPQPPKSTVGGKNNYAEFVRRTRPGLH